MDIKINNRRIFQPNFLVLLIAFALVASCVARTEPVAITPKNASQMKLLSTFGRGRILDFYISPDEESLIITSTLGIWIYDLEDGKDIKYINALPENRGYASWSPNGRMFAIGTMGRGVLILDAKTWGIIEQNEGNKSFDQRSINVTSIAWSRDSRQLAVTTFQESISIWSVKEQQWENLPELEINIVNLNWTNEGNLLILGGGINDGEYTRGIWNAHSGEMEKEMNYLIDGWGRGFWSPDGSMVLTVGDFFYPGIWDVDTGLEVVELNCCTTNEAWSFDSNLLAFGEGKVISVLDVKSGELKALDEQGDEINDITYSPNGELLALGDMGGKKVIWNMNSGEQVLVIEDHHDSAGSVVWTQHGLKGVTGSSNHTLYIWDKSRENVVAELEYPTRLSTTAWSPDKNKFSSGDIEGGIYIWDAETGKQIAKIDGHSKQIDFMAWSPDGKKLASGGEDLYLRIWKIADGEMIAEFKHKSNVERVVWSPDGTKLMAFPYHKNDIAIWDLIAMELLWELNGHTGQINAVEWSPDGNFLASTSWDGNINVWNTENGDLVLTLDGHELHVYDVSWSPDGNRLASTGRDNTIRVWDSSNGDLLFRMEYEEVGFVVWSPNGKLLATNTGDGEVVVWDANSGELLVVLEGHVGKVSRPFWSTEGDYLMTMGQDGTVRRWGIPKQ